MIKLPSMAFMGMGVEWGVRAISGQTNILLSVVRRVMVYYCGVVHTGFLKAFGVPEKLRIVSHDLVLRSLV